jgi:hypothetical protein
MRNTTLAMPHAHVRGFGMIGDLVLIKSSSKKAAISVAAQRVLATDLRTPAYTHVAVMVGAYKAVHAMPAPEHVGLALTYELLSPSSEWIIWRHLGLSELIKRNQKAEYTFCWNTEQFIGEHYNNPALRQTKENHSFCSELVGKVFSQFGFSFPVEPAKLLPITIAKAILSHPDEWLDVTSEYLTIQADPLYQRLHNFEQAEMRQKAHEAYVAAKTAANEAAALFGEALGGLNRFERWHIEDHGKGIQVWSHSASGSKLSYEAAEWLSLFMLDESDESFRELFGSTHN